MFLHEDVEHRLRAIFQVEQRAVGIRPGQAGRVSIAFNRVLAFNFLPKLLAALLTVNPQSSAGQLVISITGDHQFDRQLDSLLAGTGTQITSAYYFAIVRNFVASGGYVAVLDPINVKVDRNDDVVWRPFASCIENHLAIITAKGQSTGQATLAM